MRYGLSIPDGIIEVYKKRVIGDEDRSYRTREEIETIIKEGFDHAIWPKRFCNNTHLLVAFKDPKTDEVFSPSVHLVLNRDRHNPKGLVAATIEYFNGRF